MKGKMKKRIKYVSAYYDMINTIHYDAYYNSVNTVCYKSKKTVFRRTINAKKKKKLKIIN